VADPAVADRLYTLAPEDFVAGRNALVKELRGRGERGDAQAVAKQRRPTVSAWALNQVARSAPDLIAVLLTSGAALHRAMTDAVAGNAAPLRAAESEQRAAVDAIVARATADSAAAGHPLTDPHRQRMVATLRAAIFDGGVADSLRSGTLDSDHEAGSFGFDSADDGHEPAAPEPARLNERATLPPKPAPDQAPPAGEQAPAAETARRHRDVDRRARQAEELDREAAEAQREADHLAAQAAEAQGEADHLDETAAEAQRRAAHLDETAAEAKRHAAHAAQSAAEAQRQAAHLAQTAAEARRRAAQLDEALAAGERRASRISADAQRAAHDAQHAKDRVARG
jgi:hypothetical protein